mmetsp:Transcript_7314/g.29769  ORF Transcript_7314/g.29769 Transcript_7314/m.29769 type:complete len:265 (-) Transcript_7314:31-825(-)
MLYRSLPESSGGCVTVTRLKPRFRRSASAAATRSRSLPEVSCTSIATWRMRRHVRASMPRSTSISWRSTSTLRSAMGFPLLPLPARGEPSHASASGSEHTVHGVEYAPRISTRAATLPTASMAPAGSARRRNAPAPPGTNSPATSPPLFAKAATSAATDAGAGSSVLQPVACGYTVTEAKLRRWSDTASLCAYTLPAPAAPLGRAAHSSAMLRSRHSKVSGAGSNARTAPRAPTRREANSAKSPTFAPTSTTMSPSRSVTPCCR